MPKPARVSAPTTSTAASENSNSEFVTIALFSGIGLLSSLIAIIMSVRIG